MPLSRKFSEQLLQNIDFTQTSLNLSNKQLGPEGAMLLAGILERNTTLTSLDLSSNQLGNGGAKVLAGVLEKNTTLTSLDLSNSKLGAEGVKYLELINGYLARNKLNKEVISTSLDLSNKQLGAEGAKVLAKALKNNATLTSLDLSNSKLGAEGVKILAGILEKNATLTNLDLSSNRPGNEGVKILAGILEKNTTLTNLDLSSNRLGNEEAKILAGVLEKNTTLTNLDLSSNRLGNKEAKILAGVLEKNTTLTSLDLRSNSLEAEGVKVLAGVLENNTALASLDLSNNKLGAEGVKYLELINGYLACNKLNKEVILTSLDLSNKRLGTEGAKILAGALEKNITLTSLDLRDNRLGTEGVKILAGILEKNTTLTSLDLRYNSLEAEGVKVLAGVLENNTALTSLDLSNNKLGTEGAKILAGILEKNTTLTSLELSNNRLGNEEATYLELINSYIACNKLNKEVTLTSLDLSNKRLGAEGAKILAGALEKNITLTSLDLSNNKLGAEGAKILAGILEKNTTLTSLDLSNNKLGAEELKILAGAQEKNITLTSLDLSNNKLDVIGTAYLELINGYLARNKLNKIAIKEKHIDAPLLLANIAASRNETLLEIPNESDINSSVKRSEAESLGSIRTDRSEFITAYINNLSDSKTIEILQKPVTTNKELKSLNSDSNVLKVNLVQAITGRKLQEVKSILESNPNLFYLPLQENNRTALLLAHEKNSSKVVEVIISTMGGKDKVTDILIEDRNLNHTFYTAVKLFRTATINSFLSNFSLKDKISHIALPRVSSSLSFDQATLNEKLLDAVEQGYPILVELLLHFGADIHVKSLHHQTSGELIHTAASRGHIEILNLFLNKGFDVDELDENNNTPLHIACSSNNSNISVIKWLIEKGADILCKNDEGDCPIHAAINSEKSADDKLKIISLMIDKNKNILNIEDAIGNSTVLHIAAEQGLDDIVELLIIVGADFTKTNAEGKNVKEIARNKGKIEEIIRTNQNVISQGLRQISYHQIILGERIGHGSFGDVYKSTWLGKEVAVKQLRTNILNISDEAKEQFLNEARIISSKQHPNIINMIGVTIQPHYCLIMNYMEKGDLFNYIHKNSITWDFSIKISKDISTGLEFLHSEKILHRDLKTSNIIIDNNMNAKITDFGLSKIKEDTINASTIGTLRICGTPGYIAPEIYEQGNKKQSGISARIHYTRESDMYSYGVILWELATKQIPSENRDDEAEMELIPSNCSFKYAALIKACWSKNTKARPTAAKIIDSLAKINTEDFKAFPGEGQRDIETELKQLQNSAYQIQNMLDSQSISQAEYETRMQQLSTELDCIEKIIKNENETLKSNIVSYEIEQAIVKHNVDYIESLTSFTKLNI